jgi:hypothetical protein
VTAAPDDDAMNRASLHEALAAFIVVTFIDERLLVRFDKRRGWRAVTRADEGARK